MEESAQSNQSERRQERCPVSGHQEITGQFMTGPESAPIILPCALADLSVGGCAVRLDTSLKREPQIAIVRFELDSDLHLECAGRVCWSRQASIGYRTYGLRFRRALSEDFVDRWIHRGVLNRRDKQRTEAEVEVAVRRSAGGGSVIDGRVLNYSGTGLQLETNLPLSVDERIMVTLPDGRGIVVKIVWSVQRDGAFYSGCAFSNRVSSDNVTAYFTTQNVAPEPSRRGVVDLFKRCIG
ncbi:MAG: PilZ domain-containing protein [Planctomycetota bacterium]